MISYYITKEGVTSAEVFFEGSYLCSDDDFKLIISSNKIRKLVLESLGKEQILIARIGKKEIDEVSNTEYFIQLRTENGSIKEVTPNDK
jgi:hypothetical protein